MLNLTVFQVAIYKGLFILMKAEKTGGGLRTLIGGGYCRRRAALPPNLRARVTSK